MIELAEVFRRFAAVFISSANSRRNATHCRRISAPIDDILACRTAALGGQFSALPEACGSIAVFSYHSCGNRSCPAVPYRADPGVSMNCAPSGASTCHRHARRVAQRVLAVSAELSPPGSHLAYAN